MAHLVEKLSRRLLRDVFDLDDGAGESPRIGGLLAEHRNPSPLVFFRELPKHFLEIGQVVPSSGSLARTMLRPIRRAERPLKILEVGPGTGPFTKRILRMMGPQDELTICEINPRLLTMLKRRLAPNLDYRAHRGRVEYYLGPVQDLRHANYSGKFDVIISSLPFSNFTPEMVSDILSLYRELLAENGTLTFYEYLGVRKLGATLVPKERARLKAVDSVMKEWRKAMKRSGSIRAEVTLLNIPPAITLEAQF